MIALPALGIVFAALMALLFLLAWPIVARAMSKLMSFNLPIIGNRIASLLYDGLEVAYMGANAFLDSVVYPMAQFIERPVAMIEGVFNNIYNAITAGYSTMFQIVHSVIPAAVTRAETYALNGINAAEAYARALTLGVTNALAAGIAATRNYATDLFNIAAADLAAGIAATRNYATDLARVAASELADAVTATRNYATDLFNDAGALLATNVTALLAAIEQAAARAAIDTAHALTAAEAYADTTALTTGKILITDVDHDVATAVNTIWAGVTAGAVAVEGVIGLDLPDILAGIKAIPRAIPTDIATAIAGSAAISIPVLKFLEQCGIPNCKNLSQLGRDLQALLGLVDDAAFLALAVELIHNPKQGADDVLSVFTPIFDGAMSAAKDLLSV